MEGASEITSSNATHGQCRARSGTVGAARDVAAAALIAAAPTHGALRGHRLGSRERAILLCAPPELDDADELAFNGMAIDAVSRAERQAAQRAARKLEDLGLVTLGTARQYTTARDPRRERGFWHNGVLYQHDERWQRRRHTVYRTTVYLSLFGSEIVRRYRTELEAGGRIRWDERVTHAWEAAARRQPTFQRKDAELRRKAEAHVAFLRSMLTRGPR